MNLMDHVNTSVACNYFLWSVGVDTGVAYGSGGASRQMTGQQPEADQFVMQVPNNKVSFVILLLGLIFIVLLVFIQSIIIFRLVLSFVKEVKPLKIFNQRLELGFRLACLFLDYIMV